MVSSIFKNKLCSYFYTLAEDDFRSVCQAFRLSVSTHSFEAIGMNPSQKSNFIAESI